MRKKSKNNQNVCKVLFSASILQQSIILFLLFPHFPPQWCDVTCIGPVLQSWGVMVASRWLFPATELVHHRRGPVGSLSLPGLLWSTWSFIMSAVLAHFIMEEVTGRATSLAALSPLKKIHFGLPRPHIPFSWREIKKYKDGLAENGSKWEGADRQMGTGRAESIKAHQIKNSCTLNVTNTGWGE